MRLKRGEYIQRYRKALIDALHQDSSVNSEDSFLYDPTTTNIQKAVLLKYEIEKAAGTLSNFDEKSIQEFIGRRTLSEEIIKDVGVNPYRSLSNFLLNTKIKSRYINLNLLAWLIDFEPRPFEIYSAYLKKSKSELDIATINSSLTSTSETLPESKKIREFQEFFKQFLTLYESVKKEGMDEFFGQLFNPHIKRVIDHWGEERLRPIIEGIMEKKIEELLQNFEKIKDNKGSIGRLALYFTPIPKLENVKNSLLQDFCYELEDFGLDEIDFFHHLDTNEEIEDDDDYDDID